MVCPVLGHKNPANAGVSEACPGSARSNTAAIADETRGRLGTSYQRCGLASRPCTSSTSATTTTRRVDCGEACSRRSSALSSSPTARAADLAGAHLRRDRVRRRADSRRSVRSPAWPQVSEWSCSSSFRRSHTGPPAASGRSVRRPRRSCCSTIPLVHGGGAKSLAACIGTALALLLTLGLADRVHLVGDLERPDDRSRPSTCSRRRMSRSEGSCSAGRAYCIARACLERHHGHAGLDGDGPAARKPEPGLERAGRTRHEPSDGTTSPRRSTPSCSPTPAPRCPCSLIFSLAGTSFASAINSESVAGPIVATLVGSIGLIAAVPLTTALATLLALRLSDPRDSTRRLRSRALNATGGSPCTHLSTVVRRPMTMMTAAAPAARASIA